MKRLRFLIIVFCAALSIPLAYFILSTYEGLAREEAATLRYFAETLFDEMENALEAMVVAEESRAIDEYNFYLAPSSGAVENQASPLSLLPKEKFLLGYFQNNPDGSFQTPLVETGENIPGDRTEVVARLKRANRIFNQKRVTTTDVIKPRPAQTVAQAEEKREKGFAVCIKNAIF